MDTIIPDIDKIMSKLELLLRGGQSKIQSNEIQELLILSNKIYLFFFNIVSKGNEYNSNQKNQFLELAVKLHNKARNLTSQNLTEIRTILKASCAWMFIIFGDKNSKILSTIIKLLTKCGEEFHLNHKNNRCASECYNSVCILWSNSNDIPIYNDLPPLELQEIKLAVFRSLIGKINIEINNDEKNFEIKKIKQNFASILSLVSGLHIRYRLLIIDRLLKVGHKCADLKMNLRDALHFITIALDLLDNVKIDELINCNDDNVVSSKVVDEFKEQIIEYKIKSFLMLVYIYSETDELPKALASINAIEKIESENATCLSKIDSLSHSILFAKLTVALKENNNDKVDLLVKNLLKNPRTPFQTALSAVKKVIDSNMETEKERVSELFKLLVNKYPNDPEFTMIRISHLQATISSMKLEEKEDENQGQRGRDIAIRILSDHLDKTHELCKEDFHLFRNIITEQLKWYDSLNLWNLVKIWSDLLISLTESSEESQEFSIGGYILKIEALIKLKEYAEALSISNKLISKNISTKTIAIYFKTLLYNDDIDEKSIIKKILSLQNKSNVNENSSLISYNTEDNLKQLIICCYIAQQSEIISQRKKDNITIYFLRAWIELYCEKEVWKNQLNSSIDTKMNVKDDSNFKTSSSSMETNLEDLEESKLLDIVKDYIIFYMKHLQDLYSEISLCIISNNETNSKLLQIKSKVSETNVASIDDSSKNSNEIELENKNKMEVENDSEADTIILSNKVSDCEDILPTQAQTDILSQDSKKNSSQLEENKEEGKMEIEDLRDDTEKNNYIEPKDKIDEITPKNKEEIEKGIDEEEYDQPLKKPKNEIEEEILMLKNKNIRENFKLSLLKISKIIEKLRDDLLPILFLIRHYIEKLDNKSHLHLFGTNSNYEWISKISNYLGCFLLDLNESNLKIIEKNLFNNDNEVLNEFDEKVQSVENNNINNLDNDLSIDKLSFFNSLYVKTLLLSSEFFIISEFFLANCEYSVEYQVKDRVRLLLTASASILDSLDVNSDEKDEKDSKNERENEDLNILINKNDEKIDEINPIKKLTTSLLLTKSNFLLKKKDLIKKSKELCEKAQKLQHKLMDFADQEDQLLHNTSTILLLTCYSKDGDINYSEDFIKKNANDIKLLSIIDLKTCIDLISSSRNFSIEAVRLLIDFGINSSITKIQQERNSIFGTSTSSNKNLSSDSVTPNLLESYYHLGWMYRNLIELAPSRKVAYDKVLEFENLIKDTYNYFNITLPASPSIQIFNQEDIDQILALSYNYAITLIDLDQLQLAELFMKRALSLLNYSSENCKEYQPRLQETFAYIITLKNENSKNSNIINNENNDQSNQSNITPSDSFNTNKNFISNVDTDYGKVGHISLDQIKN